MSTYRFADFFYLLPFSAIYTDGGYRRTITRLCARSAQRVRCC
jgi:hypothetical protein